MSTNLPTPPPVAAVQNPATLPRQSFLRDLLDPSKATYLGNKYRPDLQAAGRDLRGSLDQFGDYDFAESPDGMLTATKKQTGQPGRAYKDSYFDQRAAAAARGMLDSRTAESAVGDAWYRLTEQERAVHNQYAATTSGILSRQADEFTGVTTELYGLYGQDIQYALENPVIPPAQGNTGDAGGGASQRAGGAVRPAAPLPGAPRGIDLGSPDMRWTGRTQPNKATLSKAWGVPISQITVKTAGDGTFVAGVR